jgi:hypothetical protein
MSLFNGNGCGDIFAIPAGGLAANRGATQWISFSYSQRHRFTLSKMDG